MEGILTNQRHSDLRAKIIEELGQLSFEDMSMVLRWMLVANNLHFRMGIEFPKERVRAVFAAHGFKPQSLRLDALKTAVPENHARMLICKWLHDIGTTRSQPPCFDYMQEEVDHWHELHAG